jgi:hypothetical protein
MGEDLRDRCGSPRHASNSPEVLVPHRNAPLTKTGRLRLARCGVDEEWSLRRAEHSFRASVTTAKRWADRYRLQNWAHAVAAISTVDKRSHPYRPQTDGKVCEDRTRRCIGFGLIPAKV